MTIWLLCIRRNSWKSIRSDIVGATADSDKMCKFIAKRFPKGRRYVVKVEAACL